MIGKIPSIWSSIGVHVLLFFFVYLLEPFTGSRPNLSHHHQYTASFRFIDTEGEENQKTQARKLFRRADKKVKGKIHHPQEAQEGQKAQPRRQSPPRFATENALDRSGSQSPLWIHFQPPPIYPEEAKQNHWQGTVVLEIETDETGSVKKVQVKASSGFKVLDSAAVETVKTWRAKPKTRLRVPLVFQLVQQ